VRLADTSDLTITDLSDQAVQLGLAQGTARLSVADLSQGDTLEVDTPNGALLVLNPGAYRIDVATADSATLVSVDSGSLEVSGGDVSQTFQGAQAVRLTGGNPVQVQSVAMAAPDGFDRWSAGRDHALASATSARYVSRDVPGYADLDGAGRWEDSPDGPVWYPAAVPVGWVPYRYGRWVWVEPWGWTWVEDEPWGFAPFHYGRWAFVGSAWGWFPGPVIRRPCYAPALVAFVDGSGFAVGVGVGVQAWFPLGPREPYYPWYHHSDDYLRVVNVTNIRNVTDINVITHGVTRIDYVNRRVATTAVEGTHFRRGEPVARNVVAVDPERATRAPLVPHPSVAPAATAELGGRVAPAPRVATRPRPMTVSRATPTLPTRPATLPNRPAVIPRSVAPARAARPLVARRPAPPPTPSFPARSQAMQAHPGRPLEPQQVQNLRAGRPAGPMRDREVPPHPAPAPRAAPRAAPAAGPRAAPKRGH